MFAQILSTGSLTAAADCFINNEQSRQAKQGLLGKIMFDRPSFSTQMRKQWYRFGQRLPVYTAAGLLADRRYQYYIEQLSELAKLPEEHFRNFYQSVIYRFAEFVQVIPKAPHEPLGSSLTDALIRGLNTLDYFVKNFDNPTPLERYAIFTACFFRDISNIITRQKVYITDADGVTLKTWQPFCGPMTEEVLGDSYKIFPLAQIYERVAQPIRVSLVRQVMGEHGFLWIASDLRLFSEWLEALAEEDEEGSGRLIKVIKAYRRAGGGLIDELPYTEIEILDSPATEYADRFYQWLIEGLQDQTIKVNTSDAHVHITEGGIFIETPGIFKEFAQLHNVPVNHFVVFTQFGNLMGVARKGGHDYQHAQLFSDYPDNTHVNAGASFIHPLSHKGGRIREGILIANSASVYLNGKVPDVTPHVKLPVTMRQGAAQIEQFNSVMNPKHGLKNR